MKKDFDKLDDTFNITSESSIVEIEDSDIDTKIKKNDQVMNFVDDIKKDYEYSRGNLYSIIEKGQSAINGILELAEETETPRAYEVAGQLIKNVADVTEKLLDLQKKLKDIDETKQKAPTNVTNALFIGSTAELSKLLKQQKLENK